MKRIFLSVVFICLTFCASAQLSTNQPSRFLTKVVSYEGKIGSGENSRSINHVTNAPGTGGGHTVASPGYESELRWTFVGRNGDQDVYQFTFTRMTKVGSSSKTTTSKDVQFAGKQIIVFEDELHAVVMESPSEADLKQAQKH